jgi:heat shock protein HslJ
VPPTPTPVPDPIIYSFTARPAQITLGNQLRVSWNVGGGAEIVNIYKDGVLVLENAAFQDSVVDLPNAVGTITYAIEATNSAGARATGEAQATVIEAAPDDPLAGTAWLLLSYYDGTAQRPVLEDSPVSVNFSQNNEMFGSGGCNDYSATYTVSDSQITISNLLNQQAACSPGLNQQEAAYFALLQSASTYALNDGELTISNADGQAVLVFAALVAVPLQ